MNLKIKTGKSEQISFFQNFIKNQYENEIDTGINLYLVPKIGKSEYFFDIE